MLFGEHATCQAEAEFPELWTGLVGAWSPCLSPRGGTVLRDLSGRGNHGTLTNMDPATDWVTKNGKGSLDFDTNDYIAIPSAARASLPGEYTIEAWIVLYTSSGIGQIIGNVDASGTSSQYAFEVHRTAKRLSVLANGVTVGATSNQDLATNTVYHVAVTKSGTTGNWTFAFAVNGASHGGGTTVQNPHATETVAIGRGGAFNGAYFNGAILDLTIKTGVRDVSLPYRLGPGGWATPRRRRWNYATAQTAIPYWVFARKNARLIGGGVT